MNANGAFEGFHFLLQNHGYDELVKLGFDLTDF